MNFILSIFLLQAATAAPDEPYRNLINFYESESTVFVKPISGENNEPISYEEIREQAMLNCKHARVISGDDEEVIDGLIEIEKQYPVPKQLRGMLVAAACSESGYDPKAKGDHKFSKTKKKAMAIGILQMWPWWESKSSGYGISRTDYKQSAHAWMKHIMRKLPKVKRLCKYRTPERQWVAAWVTAIRAPKATGRCREKPLHLPLLKKWHRLIRIERDFGDGC